MKYSLTERLMVKFLRTETPIQRPNAEVTTILEMDIKSEYFIDLETSEQLTHRLISPIPFLLGFHFQDDTTHYVLESS